MLFSADPNIALQSAAPGLGWFMMIISILGAPEFYIIVLPLIYWCYDRTLGLRLLLLLGISAASNGVLKLVFHCPRPYWVDSRVQALSSEPAFGMPSGGAQCSLTFLGALASWFKSPRAWAACIILVLLVGIARLYLGLHFLIDVLTGWGFALIILFLYFRYEDMVAAWMARQTAGTRILTVFAASLLPVVVAGVVLAGSGAWQVPAGWSAQASAASGVPIDPLSPRDVLMAAGILFGAGAGAVISRDNIPFSTSGKRSEKVLRYLAGIAVVIAIWVTLSPAAHTPGIAGDLMTYGRAAIGGFWITAGAPYLFRRAGLARAGDESQG